MVRINEKYVERILRKDSATVYKEGVISEAALDSLVRGIESKKSGDLEKAVKSLGIAWAFNAIQEYPEGMEVCDKLMESYGVSPEDINKVHKYGQYVSKKVLNLLNATLVSTRGYNPNLMKRVDIEELPLRKNEDGTYNLDFNG